MEKKQFFCIPGHSLGSVLKTCFLRFQQNV